MKKFVISDRRGSKRYTDSHPCLFTLFSSEICMIGQSIERVRREFLRRFLFVPNLSTTQGESPWKNMALFIFMKRQKSIRQKICRIGWKLNTILFPRKWNSALYAVKPDMTPTVPAAHTGGLIFHNNTLFSEPMRAWVLFLYVCRR